MPCRAFKRLVSETEAWAQLVGVDILDHLVGAQASIHRELIGDFPLVLTIDAHKPADFGGFIAYSLWRSIGAIADTAWLDDREIVNRFLFATDHKTGANNIGWVDII